MPEGYYKIDSLKSGETANLDSMNPVSHSGNIHLMINDVYFSNSSSGRNKTEKKRYMDLQQEGNILRRMYDYGNGQIEGIKFIAFSKTEIHKPLLVNGTPAKKNERNVLIVPVDIVFKNGGKAEYPLGFVPYDVVNTSNLNYEMGINRFYGNGSAEILFKIDTDVSVEEFEIKTSTTQSKAFNENYSIYNVVKKAYEPLKDTTISGENLKNYLSAENTVKVKLEVNDGEIGVPQMAARGRTK
jgi:hypothetical protein